MRRKAGFSFVFACFSFIILSVLLQSTTSQFQNSTQTINGKIINGSIFYSEDTFSIGNLQNPISLQITTNFTSAVYICLNSNHKVNTIAGTALNNVCPPGSFVETTSSTPQPLTSTLRSKRVTQNNKSFLEKLNTNTKDADLADGGVVNINSKPANETAGLTVSMPTSAHDANEYAFSILLEWSECVGEDKYPVNGECQDIEMITIADNSTITINTLAPSTWQYYSIILSEDGFQSDILNTLQLSVLPSSTKIYVQQGYLPTLTWYLPTGSNDGTSNQTITTPGYTTEGQQYFIGLYNDGSDAITEITLTLSAQTCLEGNIGPSCVTNPANNAGENAVYQLSCTLDYNDNNETTSSDNTGMNWNFDFSSSDYDGQYAYFSLIDLPIRYADIKNRAFVRVSVAAENIDDDDSRPPTLYAKNNGYPSAQSFDYMVSENAVVNQLSLPYFDSSDNWVIAVELPANIAIWTGVNCANNCTHNEIERGICYCSVSGNPSVINCQDGSVADFYRLPSNVLDSAGDCDCNTSYFDQSFDCSEKSDSSAIVIALVTVVGAVIVALLIFIPTYLYLLYKKRTQYEKIF